MARLARVELFATEELAIARVTTLGAGVDGTVRRLSKSYEVRGMATKQTSWDDAITIAGNVVNECQFAFNNFAQATTDYQNHSGAVNTNSTPKVQYGYANGSANTIRPTTMTYPNGGVLNYNYGTASGINDSLSRIGSLIENDGTTHLAGYSFVDLGSAVIVNYTQLSVEYIMASAGASVIKYCSVRPRSRKPCTK